MIEVYDCFQRTWWKDNADWPNGLEPHAGRKNFYFKNEIGKETHAFFTEEEAVDFCKQWNDTHDAGRYSCKAEYQIRPTPDDSVPF